jgi:alcohol dehydrogenase
MVVMGISSEPLVVTSEIIHNRSRIIGSQQNDQEYLYEALDYVAKGKVKVIAETYSLHDIARAYENVARKCSLSCGNKYLNIPSR